jgi:carbon-monoxide dehydrogenase large subunit
LETGEIRLLDYLATQDSGTVLNPKVLENQVIGGAIMGSGFALKESLSFNPETGEILNPGFLDYKVLRAQDFPIKPEVILCESYDPVGPFGAKSAGEAKKRDMDLFTSAPARSRICGRRIFNVPSP